jgi:hypothetical protein
MRVGADNGNSCTRALSMAQESIETMKHVWQHASLRPIASSVMALALVGAAAATIRAAAPVITLTFGTPSVVCTTSGGSVSAGYTITTTAGDAAAVTETLSLNGNEVQSHTFTVASGNVLNGGGWTFAGRSKTFDGTFTADGLANGTYTLEVCAAQNGSNGNPGKAVCLSETIVVSCGSVDPTCSSEPFGEVVGNTHITDHATVQVNFRGDFGDSAILTIVSPAGVAATATINRDGNSCNYHANWKFTNPNGADISGNDGPGVYALTVTGNGHTLTFFVTLT